MSGDEDDMKSFIMQQMKKLATSDQMDRIGDEVKRNADSIQQLRGVVEKLERDAVNDRRSLQSRVENVVASTSSGSGTQGASSRPGGGNKRSRTDFDQTEESTSRPRTQPKRWRAHDSSFDQPITSRAVRCESGR